MILRHRAADEKFFQHLLSSGYGTRRCCSLMEDVEDTVVIRRLDILRSQLVPTQHIVLPQRTF